MTIMPDERPIKPRRTHESNQVYRLTGGNEDNDLWVRITEDQEGAPVVCSVWVPDDEARAAIAAGANIELVVWGGQPPVAMHTTDVALGRRRPPRPV